MTWTKLSDDFGEDCWVLSDAAFRLHVEGLLWSNQHLLDGRVPKDDLRRFAKNPDALPELLDDGTWTDEGNSFQIVHHIGNQPTREQTLAFRESRSANGKKGGRPRKDGNHGAKHRENHSAKHDEKPDEKLQGRDGAGLVSTGTGEGKTKLSKEENMREEEREREERRLAAQQAALTAAALGDQPQPCADRSHTPRQRGGHWMCPDCEAAAGRAAG